MLTHFIQEPSLGRYSATKPKKGKKGMVSCFSAPHNFRTQYKISKNIQLQFAKEVVFQ